MLGAGNSDWDTARVACPCSAMPGVSAGRLEGWSWNHLKPHLFLRQAVDADYWVAGWVLLCLAPLGGLSAGAGLGFLLVRWLDPRVKKVVVRGWGEGCGEGAGVGGVSGREGEEEVGRGGGGGGRAPGKNCILSDHLPLQTP